MKTVTNKAPASNSIEVKESNKTLPFEDDRYPGSFFRIPGVPLPGKTSWNITKLK
jgi:hypothetical protein